MAASARFTKGRRVEVSFDEAGLRGAWYVATIVNIVNGTSTKKNSKNSSKDDIMFEVKYDTLYQEDDTDKLLTEVVDPCFVRPVPPFVFQYRDFEVDDVVDVYQRGGWWIGVVKNVIIIDNDGENSKKYVVGCFEDPTVLEVESEKGEIRFHLEWVDSCWEFPPNNKNINEKKNNNEETCEVKDCKTMQKRKRGRSPMSQAERPDVLQKAKDTKKVGESKLKKDATKDTKKLGGSKHKKDKKKMVYSDDDTDDDDYLPSSEDDDEDDDESRSNKNESEEVSGEVANLDGLEQGDESDEKDEEEVEPLEKVANEDEVEVNAQFEAGDDDEGKDFIEEERKSNTKKCVVQVRRKKITGKEVKVSLKNNQVVENEEDKTSKALEKRLVLRFSPKTFYNVMNKLNTLQKSNIADLGFGSLIDFPIYNVPTKLAYYVLEKFDEKESVLEVNGNLIKVTKERIHEVFGIPIGGKKIKYFEEAKMTDDVTKKWRKQFGKGRISITQLINVMKGQKKGGLDFKLNFLVLFITIMAEGNKCNTVNQKFLPSITKPKEIKDLDWCQYVFECLKKTKSEWNRNSHFNGPIVFLMVLFAHETVKDEEYALPLLKNWSSEKFKAIQAEKIKNSELKKELVGEEAKQSSAMKKRKIVGNQKSWKSSLMEQKMDDDEDNEHENGESQRQNNESEEDLENNKEENLDGHEQDDESDEKDEDEVEGIANEKQISQEQIDEEETNLDEDEKEDESDENNEEKGEVKANEDQISREESNDKAGKANNEQVEKEDTEFQFVYDNLFGEIQSLEDFNTFTDESIVQKTCEAEDCNTVQKRKRGRSPMSQAERPNDLQKGISCSKRADQQVWPFIKQSALWATIESLESYRQLPQKPHFSPLKKVKEDHREGLAISHVVTFENLVQKILKIQLTDPADIIKDSLETLVNLETHGFDVGAFRARLNELLSWKDKVGQLRDMARKDEESQKCEQEEMNQLEVRIKELQKKMEENEMMKNMKNEKVMKLQSNLCLLSKQIIDCELAFKKLAATPL